MTGVTFQRCDKAQPSAKQPLGIFLRPRDQNQITDYLTRVVQPKLSAISGVQRAEILGVIPPQVSLDTALRMLEDEAKTILPPGQGFTVDYAGESRQLRTEGGKFFGTFVLSGILIYLVLAAQFESFRDPLIVLAGSVPLALSGALARNSIGMMLVTGMTIGSAFTLFVVPSIYVLLAKTHRADIPTAEETEEPGLRVAV